MLKTKTATEPCTVGTIYEMIELGMLLDNHPLQRRSERHSKAYRDGFIATVIKNEDFDPIKVCEEIRPDGTYNWLIDGVQRLTEISSYKNNMFKLGKTVEMPIITYQKKVDDENGTHFEETEFDLRGKGFNDLPKEIQTQFNKCPITIVKQLDCSEDEISYHIRRYNHSRAMCASEINITYADRFARIIKSITGDNKFFLDCGNYKDAERKRGDLEKFVMETYMTVFHLDDWKTGTKMGNYINENATTEEFEKINDYFTRLYPICEGKYENYFNNRNTLVFVAAFDIFTKFGLDDSKFADFLDNLDELSSKEIDGATFDELNANTHPKDKQVIIAKIDMLEKLMNDFFGNEKVKTESPLEFLRNNISEDLTESDVEALEEDLDLYTLDVDNNSKLLQEGNHNSLLGIIAYAYQYDLDIDEWFIEYFKANNCFVADQCRNLMIMIQSLRSFQKAA